MPSLKDLYNDKRFSGVSDQTKTDIISTIGIDINDANDDISESKFTPNQLQQALHYLLATEAKQNPNVQRLVLRESPSTSNSYASSPFYFGNDDPLMWYWAGHQMGHMEHHHGGGSGCGSCGGMDCKGDGECAALACAAALVCSAGCCCAICMAQTIDGPESNGVKAAKVTTSTLTGAAVFVFLLVYLMKNDIWRSSLVDDHDWDVAGYRAFLVLISAFGGLLSSGAVSTVNNIWRCLPNQERNIPEPSAEVLAALNDLQTVKKLLSQGWARTNDDHSQCDAFIREVIMTYINSIAFTPTVRVEKPVSPASSRITTFGRPTVELSPRLLPPVYNPYSYVALQGEAPNNTSSEAPGGPRN